MRLIDADELKKDICKWLRPSNPDENEMVDICDIAISVMMEIEEQPVAFNKEKVLEQLKSNVVIGADCVGEGFECIPAFKAFEIVEGGEINDK